MLTLQERIEKLLSKSESMVLLCSKASGYWSMIKFSFNIPLVLTSSAMCIINSISEDVNEVKVPNIVVNAISDEITDSEFQLISLKYENLINDVLFEEIPQRYKLQVADSFKNRVVPLQLNGTIGNNVQVEIVKIV